MIKLSMFNFSQSTSMIWITTFPDPTAVSLSIFSWSLSHLSIEWQKAKNKQIKQISIQCGEIYLDTPVKS